MKVITKVIQYVLGIILIISGFVKLNDPLGFMYKLEEYYSPDVLDLPLLMKFALVNGFMVSLVELVLGVAIIVGWKKVQTLALSILMFVFFGFLTFYSAYYNKVTDCGCFGDAIHFTPWQSFSKDMFLFALTIFLWFNKKHITEGKFALRKVLKAIVLGSAVSMYALYSIPMIDFRPYKIGVDIEKSMKIPEGAKKDVYKETWYYRVGGEVKEFTTDDAPWSIEGAEFVERKTDLISKGYEPEIHDFALIKDGEDYTEDILNMDSVWCVILLDIKLDIEEIGKVKAFLEGKENIIVISPSSNVDVAEFKKLIESNIDVYSIDETTCKTIIRSNPGILRLEKGVVKEKFRL